jgi:hypothetical protein
MGVLALPSTGVFQDSCRTNYRSGQHKSVYKSKE